MSREAREWLEGCAAAEQLPSARWAVLWRLCWHYNEQEGGAWPGIQLLRARTHLSKSTVHRALQDLERDDWIKRHNTWRSSTFYTLPRYRPGLAMAGTEVGAHHDVTTSSHDDTQPSQAECRRSSKRS